MTWGATASGPGAAVIEKAEDWPAAVAQVGRQRGLRDLVCKAHQRQVAHALEAVKEFAGRLPPGYQMTVSANGHFDDTSGADSWNVNMGAYRPVPVPVAWAAA